MKKNIQQQHDVSLDIYEDFCRFYNGKLCLLMEQGTTKILKLRINRKMDERYSNEIRMYQVQEISLRLVDPHRIEVGSNEYSVD